MQKRLAIYYHVWSPPSSPVWRFLVDEQLKHIARSGVMTFADVRCSIACRDHAIIEKFIKQYDGVNIIGSTDDETQFEGTTLRYLYNACHDENDLDAICYMHTKGITCFSTNTSDAQFKATNSWRHFLEWGVLAHWQEAVQRLQNHDVVGVNYNPQPWPHMSGNFFWSKPSYVRTLIDPHSDNFPPGTAPNREKVIEQRLCFERWIGMNNPSVYSFYNQPAVGYSDSIERCPDLHLYFQDIEPYYRRFGRGG